MYDLYFWLMTVQYFILKLKHQHILLKTIFMINDISSLIFLSQTKHLRIFSLNLSFCFELIKLLFAILIFYFLRY